MSPTSNAPHTAHDVAERHRHALGVSLPLMLLASTLLPSCNLLDRTPPASLVLTNATIVEVNSGTLQRGVHIVVRGDRIEEIVAGTAPAAVRTVDASGAFVIPGLWDMQVTLPADRPDAAATLLAAGITGIRAVDTDRGLVDRLREEIAAGFRAGPRIYRDAPLAEGAERPEWLVPLLGAADSASLAELGAETAARFREGVPVMAGSGTGSTSFDPYALHAELERLAAAGLSPAEVLRVATMTPVRYVGEEATLGAIGQGKLADFVLLGGNPLEDVRNLRAVKAVVTSGRYLERRGDALVDGPAPTR